jgi:RNA polymerase sigma-70 factor, ECF subfamily
LLEHFIAAIETDDRHRLLTLLAPDAVLMSDGGGKVLAARNPILGADRIARFLLGLARKQTGTLAQEIAVLNGGPAAVRWRDGQVHSTISIAADAGGIHAIYVVLNPHKLRRLGASQPASAAR